MSAYEGRDPYEDYVIINKELENFNNNLLKKPQINTNFNVNILI